MIYLKYTDRLCLKLIMKICRVFVLSNIHNLLSYICSLYAVGNIPSITQESSQATSKIKAAHFFK